MPACRADEIVCAPHRGLPLNLAGTYRGRQGRSGGLRERCGGRRCSSRRFNPREHCGTMASQHPRAPPTRRRTTPVALPMASVVERVVMLVEKYQPSSIRSAIRYVQGGHVREYGSADTSCRGCREFAKMAPRSPGRVGAEHDESSRACGIFLEPRAPLWLQHSLE